MNSSAEGSNADQQRLEPMKMEGDSVRIRDVETIAHNKGKLISVSYEQRRRDGEQQQRKREIYDNGNSAVILPYDPDRKTVLLTRQLRLPISCRTAWSEPWRHALASSTARKPNDASKKRCRRSSVTGCRR